MNAKVRLRPPGQRRLLRLLREGRRFFEDRHSRQLALVSQRPAVLRQASQRRRSHGADRCLSLPQQCRDYRGRSHGKEINIANGDHVFDGCYSFRQVAGLGTLSCARESRSQPEAQGVFAAPDTASFALPTRRMPLGRHQDIHRADPGGRVLGEVTLLPAAGRL
jgi:hypothetical protein